ncbi:MAG TPA: ATP-binding cassette domain-containing protein [Acidimicrobiales bacterium]|nr:ATP-binding cassette domain-containing protein [Acidimicrobiales bacterium]
MCPAPHPPVICFRGVGLVREGTRVLDQVDWVVGAGERWVVLGPNGSGKTSLLQVAGAAVRPSSGVAEVLGRRLGRADLRELRANIALVSGALTRAIRPDLHVGEVVLTGASGVLVPWWESHGEEDRARVAALLAELGVGGIGERTFGVISEGERQAVLLARALMGRPGLLLLDEPAAGLDLGARERLLARLRALTGDPATPALVLVTHHVEEIPAGTTHAALMAGGRLLAAGPVDEALTTARVSACFGLPVAVHHQDGRWWARAEVG